MKRAKIKEITLWERRTETDVSILTAEINSDGDLALEGYDLGEAPQEFWGDSDYEYGRVVKKEYKDKMIQLLTEERFDSDSDLRKWLSEKRIPGESVQTVREDYRDTMLLWLVKERFDSDSGFQTWLVERNIPNEFWSWI